MIKIFGLFNRVKYLIFLSVLLCQRSLKGTGEKKGSGCVWGSSLLLLAVLLSNFPTFLTLFNLKQLKLWGKTQPCSLCCWKGQGVTSSGRVLFSIGFSWPRRKNLCRREIFFNLEINRTIIKLGNQLKSYLIGNQLKSYLIWKKTE